jgi:hypothetical protein
MMKGQFSVQEVQIMLAAVKGYYDGEQIIINESDRKKLKIGDEVIITILDQITIQRTPSRTQKRKQIIDSNAYIRPTGRSAEEIENYIKELRTDDRF